jgi:pyruvate ferredoxin oxidoreductase alpha subunit
MAMGEHTYGDGATSRAGLRGLLAQVETLVSGDAEAVMSTTATPSSSGSAPRALAAAEAVAAAAALAKKGKRASVIIAPHELFGALSAIHEAARLRAPLVVHVAPGGAHERHTHEGMGRDEIAPALELGAGVLATWSAEDAVDLTLAARRAAEDSETPWILFSEGDVGQGIALPDAALIARFLGEAEGKTRSAAPAAPLARKRAERGYATRAPFALASALRELGELTARPISPVERFATVDAEEVILAVGEAFVAARAVAEERRKEGKRVGAVGIRALRPFFATEVVKSVARARAIGVIEPLDVALAPSGPLAESLKAAFADALTWAPGFPGIGRIPPIISAVFATLEHGVRPDDVRAILDELATGDRARRLLVFGSDQG